MRRSRTAWAKAHSGPCQQPRSTRRAFAHPTSDRNCRESAWIEHNLRQNARESTVAATTSTRTASVARETKAALIGVPTLSSLFWRGRRLPYDQKSLFRSKWITCKKDHVQVSITKHQPKAATCLAPAQTAPLLTAPSTSLEH